MAAEAGALTVEGIMRTEVATVPRDAPLRELVRLLAAREMSGAPVVDADGRVVGVVSMTDVLRLLAGESGRDLPLRVGEGRQAYFEVDGPPWHPKLLPPDLPEQPALDRHTVEQVMTPARYTVRPGTTLPELARFLLEARIHRALVFERGRLVGIVTTFDVLRAVAGEEPAA